MRYRAKRKRIERVDAMPRLLAATAESRDGKLLFRRLSFLSSSRMLVYTTDLSGVYRRSPITRARFPSMLLFLFSSLPPLAPYHNSEVSHSQLHT